MYIYRERDRDRDRDRDRQRQRQRQRDRERGCKLIGSLLDAQNDIKRRKVLAINAPNKLKHLFLNKSVIISVKIQLFKTYITPIFYIISSYGNLRWSKCCILHFLHLATERSHNSKLHKILDLNSFVFTLIVTPLFKKRCFSLFCAFIASTFLLLMSFCVSRRLLSSLQPLQRLSQLALFMEYSWKEY